eukprot:GEMP01061319.1.p1 GENE.GEMP01061319.1~~GEMP01061319.1.p1  ORF type:complete len:331 (+),score=60.53 GEMP01061319.1:76-1068(+)
MTTKYINDSKKNDDRFVASGPGSHADEQQCRSPTFFSPPASMLSLASYSACTHGHGTSSSASAPCSLRFHDDERCNADDAEDKGSRTHSSATIRGFDPKGMLAAKAARSAVLFEQRFDPAKTVRCRHCWFHKKGCICSQVPPSLCVSMPFETIVVMHPSEVLRPSSSNTAKLLLWWGARRCIYGLLEDMEYLSQQFATRRCAILFPSEDAVEPNLNETGNEGNDIETIVILDAGWSPARAMNRGLVSSVTRWKLNLQRAEQDSKYGRTRKYVGAPESRTQTAHAYCELLRVLGINNEVVDQMIAGVRLSAAEFVCQNGWFAHTKKLPKQD